MSYNDETPLVITSKDIVVLIISYIIVGITWTAVT